MARNTSRSASFKSRTTLAHASKALAAAHDLGVKQIIVAGGVSANKGLREKMSTSDIPVIFPPLKYCTDNATMIGAAAYVLYKNNEFSDLDVNASSHEELTLEEM